MATKVNLIIDQGSHFIQDIQIFDTSNNAVDLTTYTGEAQVRKAYSSSTFVPFTVTTAANGIVQFQMNAANTNTLAAGQYVWDCELTELTSGIVTRIVEGVVTVTPSVTR